MQHRYSQIILNEYAFHKKTQLLIIWATAGRALKKGIFYYYCLGLWNKFLIVIDNNCHVPELMWNKVHEAMHIKYSWLLTLYR